MRTQEKSDKLRYYEISFKRLLYKIWIYDNNIKPHYYKLLSYSNLGYINTYLNIMSVCM